MEKAKVYYTDFRATPDQNLLQKLHRLLVKAGMTGMDLQGKFTAVKIHFGEPGNLAFLRPNYAKVVVDTLKDMGARPFLTDCNTLYTGMRRNALDHLTAAYENGFNPFQTGCHVIIGDGLLGTDDVAVPINGKHFDHALIGRAIMDAEAVITLNHFKCHESTGIGGALKNLGMGCGSTAGIAAALEKGRVTAIAAVNVFSAGYLAVEAAAKLARHESWTGGSSVGFSIVRQETMYSSDNQKLLFPVT